MKFAKFWENIEVRLKNNDSSEFTANVWGASNTTKEEAKASAEKKKSRLLKFFETNFKNRNDYQYSSDFIREEVLQEIQGNDNQVIGVISRNSYGAEILNCKNLLIGDIDAKPEQFGIKEVLKSLFGLHNKDKDYHLHQIEKFQTKNPNYTFLVYETFAGLRFFIINKSFEPNSSEVKKIFDALEVDPLYKNLCIKQNSFRARLTPKPWRINMERPKSRFPRCDRKTISEFDKWLRNYEKESRQKGSVFFLKKIGQDRELESLKGILKIHEKYACRSQDQLA